MQKKVARVWIFHSSAFEFEINVDVSNIRVPISVRDIQYEKETDEKICLIFVMCITGLSYDLQKGTSVEFSYATQ